MNTLMLVVNIFNNSVTKTYDGKDATIEIVLMLLGSFILGYLLRSFIGYLSKKEIIIEKNSNSKEEFLAANTVDSLKFSEINHANSETKDFTTLQVEIDGLKKRISALEIKCETCTSTVSDSKAIETKNDHGVAIDNPVFIGNNDVISNVLSKSNATETTTNEPVLTVLEKEVVTESKISTIESGISEETSNTKNVETVSIETKSDIKETAEEPSVKDDLKTIEGIGPAIEKLLNENGILTYEDLSNKTVLQLERILDEAGPRFRVHVPETWPFQSTLLKEKRIEEFNKLTAELKGGRKL